MKSFASIDRIEGSFAVCEVELISICNSKPEDFMEKETAVIDVPLELIKNSIFGDPQEGDILVVNHNGKEVFEVYYKDITEMAKRLEILQTLCDF